MLKKVGVRFVSTNIIYDNNLFLDQIFSTKSKIIIDN